MNAQQVKKHVDDFIKSNGINYSILSRAVGYNATSITQQLSRGVVSDRLFRRLGYLIPELRQEAEERAFRDLDKAVDWYALTLKAHRERKQRKMIRAHIDNPPVYARAWG